MKQPRCKQCKTKRDLEELFSPPAISGYICRPHISQGCVVELLADIQRKKDAKKAKEFNARTRTLKDGLNDRYAVKAARNKARAEFHAYCREVDHGDPCISCDRIESEIIAMGVMQSQVWQAGHYITRGSSPALAFVKDNVHKQCCICNGTPEYNGGAHNVTKRYRVNLIKKIGIKRVEKLEGPQEPARLRLDDYKAIEKEYKLKRKELRDVRF